MKISVAWIFDHINAKWSSLDIVQLIEKFNKTTAEIEGFSKVEVELDSFTLVQIKSIESSGVVGYSSEWQQEFLLEDRSDAEINALFLVKKQGNNYSWVSLEDLHCPKDGLLCQVYVADAEKAGEWKNSFEKTDYILEIDNKSITHRPDMWGHRGFAREVAAMFDMDLVPFNSCIVDKKIVSADSELKATDEFPVTFELKDQEYGKRLAGLYCEKIEQRASSLQMAYRLARTGNRPINVIVDATNYVMLDIGQPMHAFDAKKMKTLEGRFAKNGEKLVLLDDKEIELTNHDFILTDGKQPISLVGIMGGKHSSISRDTISLLLESANVDATTVRKSSARLKVRTEASARFEKSLDPNQNIDAILRFLKILDNEHVACVSSPVIYSLGKKVEQKTITISHQFICNKLGVDLEKSFVISTLKKLEFAVDSKDDLYTIIVPTFRSSKDIEIQEDIVEEIGRFFGYDNIPFCLPARQIEPICLQTVMRVRSMKQLLANSLLMREVYNYALYDESFIRTLKFEPQDCVEVQNPVSENWFRLVDSLIPHLFKNVAQGATEHSTLRFFEWARTWKKNKDEVQERKSLAGIFFDKDGLDFYDAKELVTRLFLLLGLDVSWQKAADKDIAFWFVPYQTAHLVVNGEKIGVAGMVDSVFFNQIADGQAFIFELSGDVLLAHKKTLSKYSVPSKFPAIHRDVSLMVDSSVTVDQIATIMRNVDKDIEDVSFVGVFTKDEWQNKKTITMRFVMRDLHKTMTSEDADSIYDKVVKAVEKLGAEVR